jgi:hypothetical protein
VRSGKREGCGGEKWMDAIVVVIGHFRDFITRQKKTLENDINGIV